MAGQDPNSLGLTAGSMMPCRYVVFVVMFDTGTSSVLQIIANGQCLSLSGQDDDSQRDAREAREGGPCPILDGAQREVRPGQS